MDTRWYYIGLHMMIPLLLTHQIQRDLVCNELYSSNALFSVASLCANLSQFAN